MIRIKQINNKPVQIHQFILTYARFIFGITK